MEKKWPFIIFSVLIMVVGVLFIVSLNLFKPAPEGAEINTNEWEFSTYMGGTIYNDTAYGYSSVVFNVSSASGSEVYMLSQKSTGLPLASNSLIRSSVSACKIDWGWLGFGNNYMFLTWNGTHWIADTDNESETPETTTINGYDPSNNWRKLSIEATSTQIRYFIDDVLVATHTNRIPSGDFQFYGELKSTGTASKLYIASHKF